MITHLIQVGDEKGVEIPQSVLDFMGITDETLLDVTVVDGAVVVTPIGSDERRHEVAQSLEKMKRQYRDSLRRLAGGDDTNTPDHS